MYRKILVPLDGSELAECVLPHVESIATGCEVSSVTFVRVVEPFHVPGGEWVPSQKQIDQMESARQNEAKSYLAGLTKRVKLGASEVSTKLIIGQLAAEAIADYATKNKMDLIIIATHGRSGVSRWVWGSVADRVLRSACVPVFMVRAPGCVPAL